MTDIQIKYATLLETQRANKAREDETQRANLANEGELKRSHLATEAETNRSNLAREGETKRHNLVIENHSLQTLNETKRSNLANESIQRQRNAISADQVAATREGNQLNYAIQRERNQVQREYNNALINLKGQELAISERNATTSERNADTNRYNAETNRATGFFNSGTNALLGRSGVAGVVGASLVGAGLTAKAGNKAAKITRTIKTSTLAEGLANVGSVSTFDPFMLVTLPGANNAFNISPKTNSEVLQ